MKYKKVVIIGMGLVGGSIGKALIAKKLAGEVAGVCRRQSSLDRAIKEKTLTSGFVEDYDKALPGADIIVIATPVHVIKEVLGRIAGVDAGKAIVTDVGSTKEEIVIFASKFKDRFSFVGSHPLAGSEKTGPENAAADLFEGSVCVVTPAKDSGAEDITRIKEFWEAVGVSTVEVLSPKEHDRNLAFSSHLPHVVAYALSGTREKDIPMTMFATGFKDTTRIASSDAVLWSDIFMTNRDNVLEAIARFKEALSEIEKAVKDKDEEALKKWLKDYKRLRDELF